MGEYRIGDCLEVLRTMPDGFAQACVTSPPYWGLRDYGHDGQLGLEETHEEYVAKMVEIFAEVRRVLRDDGTLWMNLGDSYAASQRTTGSMPAGLKPKDLCGIPWRVAFALQADGWYLRSDIIWHKPNPMPESVTDRPTKAHEYVFLMSKSARYYYDAGAIKVPAKHAGESSARKTSGMREQADDPVRHRTRPSGRVCGYPDERNKRTVWTVPTAPYGGAHFACYPPDLIKPCILAGCPPGGIVLDPFFGSGTTGMVAESLGRDWFGIELNPEYETLIKQRNAQPSMF